MRNGNNKFSKILSTSVILVSLGLGGCKSMKQDAVTDTHNDRVKQLESQLAMEKSKLMEVQNQYNTLRSQSASTEVEAPMMSSLLPPNAKTGECYARVLIPATYETVSKQVIKSHESTKINVIPAQYKMVTQDVLVKEASETLTTIPAKFEWVEESVLVVEESTKLKTYPAEYSTETEQLLVKPAYTTWKKGRGPIEKLDNSTGEIMCLVEIPAEYKTVSKQVVSRPARTESVVVPAQYKTVKKKVMVEPAKVVKTVVPAEYKTMDVRKLVSSAKENVVTIPAVYDTVVQQKQVSDANMEWRTILCETNTNADIIIRLQRALDKAGFNPGNIDGVLGADTRSALSAFQRENNMPAGHLTMSALKKLNVL